MSGLNNVSIRARLMLLVGLPLLAILGIGGLSIWSNRELAVGGSIQTELALDAELNADILPPPLFAVEPFLAVHALADSTPDEAPGLVQELVAHAKLFQERTAYWREHLVPGAVRSAMMDGVVKSGDAFFAAVENEFLPVARKGGSDEAQRLVNDRMTKLFRQHRQQVASAVEVVGEATRARQDGASSTVRKAGGLLQLSIVVTVAITLCLGWIISRGISGPLAELTKFMEMLAEGGGDLRCRMPGDDSRSEFGRLARAFNAFIRSLNGIIVEIGTSAREVATNTEQIAAAAEESGQSVELQASTLAEISEDVDRMVNESSTIATQAERASGSASEAREVAQRGGTTVDRTIQGMKAIETSVGAGASDVAELGTKSAEIGRIIQVINDIADQTNLLALNAAIEAARAGEHGRGFAVVADEVRKLAERTTGTTKQVTESIRCIQEQTSTAVNRMNEGNERVREGVGLAGEANDALRDIVSRVVGTTELIGTISVAVRNNNQIGEQIKGRVDSIASGARELGQAASASAAATAQLQSRTRSLLDLVGKFQTDPAGTTH